MTKHRASYADARPHINAENQTRTAAQARAEIAALRALAPVEAVERIEHTRAAEQAAREAAAHEVAAREGQLQATSRTRDNSPHYGPSLGR